MGAFIEAAPGAAADDQAVLRLASGQVVRLRDVRLAAGEAGAQARAWLRGLPGRAVRVQAAPADRWNQKAGAVALLGEAIPIDIAGLLVAEGYAVVDPGEADQLCDASLLVDEAKARERSLGGWRADGSLVKADDAAALATLTGRFVVAEGRIVSVGERPARSYLNFGRVNTGALTATLPRRSWAELKRRGHSAESLRGKRVRVRGIVELWRSPSVEVVAVDVVEVLDGAPQERPR